MALSLNLGELSLHVFLHYANTEHIHRFLTFSKRWSASVLPSDKQEQRNHELSMNILQQNVSNGTQEASLATLITPEHGPRSRPAFAKKHPHIANIFRHCRLRVKRIATIKVTIHFLEKHKIQIQSPTGSSSDLCQKLNLHYCFTFTQY